MDACCTDDASNALYDFTVQIVKAAEPDEPLFDKQIHLDAFEDIERDTIRFGNFITSDDSPGAPGEVLVENVKSFVFFIGKPESQNTADRADARKRVNAMASSWLAKAFSDMRLPDADGKGRICGLAAPVRRMNFWWRPATERMPVVRLEITVNPV